MGRPALPLIGASVGGTAALMVASGRQDVPAVITLSAPEVLDRLAAGPDVLANITGAKLFIAGLGDPAGAAASAQYFYDQSPQPKRLEIVTADDHGTDLLSGSQGSHVRAADRRVAGDVPSRRGGVVTRPIVFCTDYGLRDEFVGVCHGVMLRIAPRCSVIDLTHAIPRQDVLRGALVLSRAAPYLPVDAVYCAVVDPGVGSERRAVAVRAGTGALLVGPDNGLLSLAWSELGGAEAAFEISSPGIVLHPISNTFHGRDVFAPAAAHLAMGTSLETIGPALGS